LDAAAAWAVALAGQPVHLDRHVTELGAGPGRATVDLAAEDQAAADPGPDRQHHHVVGAAPGAIQVLGQGRDVGVVVDEDRKPGATTDHLADRQVVDRQVDGRDRDTPVVVDRGRDPEAHRGDPGPGLPGLVDLRDQQLDQLILVLVDRALTAFMLD